MKVKAYTSQCIGMTITGLYHYGKIIKTNKKSIRVRFDRFVKTYGSKIVIDREDNGTYTFTYWKTITASYGENKGKKVDLYKHPIYGIIEMVK